MCLVIYILCPTNLYPATKTGAELIANSYKFSFITFLLFILIIKTSLF